VLAVDLSSEVDRGNQTVMELILSKFHKELVFDKIPDEITATNSIVKKFSTDTSAIVYLLESRKDYGKDFVLRDELNYTYNSKGLLKRLDWKRNKVEERTTQWSDLFTDLMKHNILTYIYDESDDNIETICQIPSGEFLCATYMKFDNNGKVLEYIYNQIYDWSKAGYGMRAPYSINYQLGYNKSGLIDYVNDGSSKWIYKYDQYSNIVNKCVYTKSDENKYILTKEYMTKVGKDITGRILNIERPEKNMTNSKLYVYFKHENEGKTIIANHGGVSWKGGDYSRDIIEKDENGRTVRIEYINVSLPGSGTSHREDFKYDDKGRRIQYLYSRGGGTDPDSIYWYAIKKENQIYEQDKLKRVESYGRDWYYTSGIYILNSTVDYSYDQNGFLTEILFSTNNKSVIEPYQKRVIKNDEFGNVLSDYTYSKVAGEFVFMSGSDFTYKAHQLTKPEYNLPDVRLAPDYAISYIEILSLSEPVTLYVYNPAGVLMMNSIVNPNERLSVQDLPRGMYIYNFVAGGRTFKGKFMKSDY
jgi:YD repeat-containing protein